MKSGFWGFLALIIFVASPLRLAFAGRGDASSGPLYQSPDQVVTSSGFYVAPGSNLNFGSSVASVPAPCILGASSIPPVTGATDPGLSPVTDMNRLDLPLCEEIFPASGSPGASGGSSASGIVDAVQSLKKNVAQVLYCLYRGSLVNIGASGAVSCSGGTSTSVDGSSVRPVCNFADGEGTLSAKTNYQLEATSNLFGRSCGSVPASVSTGDLFSWNLNFLKNWLTGQAYGIWAQTVKVELDHVLGSLSSPAKQLTLQAGACQAMAQDYLALLGFSKKISDNANAQMRVDMPNADDWNVKTCTALNTSSSSGVAPAENDPRPVSLRCYLTVSRALLVRLYLQLAQCEIFGRANDVMTAFESSAQNSLLNQVYQSEQSAIQKGVDFSNDDCCRTWESNSCAGDLDANPSCPNNRLHNDAPYVAGKWFARKAAPSMNQIMQDTFTQLQVSGSFWPKTMADYQALGVTE